jgi:integrase
MAAPMEKIRHATGHVKLVERKRGGPIYYVKYRLPDGRQVQKKLGPAWTERGRPPEGHYTRRMAEAELRRLLTDAERGTLAAARKTGATFAAVAAEWLRYIEHDRQRRPSTVVGYRSALKSHLLPEFGELPVESITSDMIDNYRARLVQEGELSARSINKLLVQLHAVFKLAQRRYKLPSNPAAGIERQPLRRSGDIDVLTPVEVEALARAAASEQDAAIYTVAAFTGLRLGEVRALRWKDVDFASHFVYVRHNYTSRTLGDPKSGKVRSVPLIDQAAAAFDRLSRRAHFTDSDDLVFCSEIGTYIDESALRRRYNVALDRAGLKRLRFHDLRHTFGTLAVQAWPITDVQGYMGHADIQTTMVYVHHTPKASAAAELTKLVRAQTAADLSSLSMPRTVGREPGEGT